MRREFCVPSSVATLAAWPSSPAMVPWATRDQWWLTWEAEGKSIHLPEVQCVSLAREMIESSSCLRRGVNYVIVVSIDCCLHRLGCRLHSGQGYLSSNDSLSFARHRRLDPSFEGSKLL